jgi:outer membrane protein assembly factor BamB
MVTRIEWRRKAAAAHPIGRREPEAARLFIESENRVGIERGPVATYQWICHWHWVTVQAMKDQASDTAYESRVRGTISAVASGAKAPSCSEALAARLKSCPVTDLLDATNLIALLILSFVILLLAQPAQSENLPMFRGNAGRTGVYDAAGVPSFSHVKWTFHAKGQLISSPAVAGDAIYVGSTAGLLYAVDRVAGTEKWKFETKSRIASSPAVADGLVYFGAYDGNFYAVEAATGKLKWKFRTEGERQFTARHLHGFQPAAELMPDPWDCWLSSPAVWKDAVYFGSGDGNVYALDAATGALKWKFKTGDVVHASPAIADGTVFIGSWDSYFYAIDAATGAEKWRFKTGEDSVVHNQQGIQSSAAVVDGTVYFGCRDSHMYAVDEFTGQSKWAYATGGTWVLTSPSVSQGKVFFAISYGGLLYAADTKTGEIVYSVNFKGWPIYSSPAIAGNMLYVGSTAGTMNAVNLDSQAIAWTYTTDAAKQNGAAFTNSDGTSNYFGVFPTDYYQDVVASYAKLETIGEVLSSPVVVDNVVYFSGTDGNLYALM